MSSSTLDSRILGWLAGLPEGATVGRVTVQARANKGDVFTPAFYTSEHRGAAVDGEVLAAQVAGACEGEQGDAHSWRVMLWDESGKSAGTKVFYNTAYTAPAEPLLPQPEPAPQLPPLPPMFLPDGAEGGPTTRESASGVPANLWSLLEAGERSRRHREAQDSATVRFLMSQNQEYHRATLSMMTKMGGVFSALTGILEGVSLSAAQARLESGEAWAASVRAQAEAEAEALEGDTQLEVVRLIGETAQAILGKRARSPQALIKAASEMSDTDVERLLEADEDGLLQRKLLAAHQRIAQREADKARADVQDAEEVQETTKTRSLYGDLAKLSDEELDGLIREDSDGALRARILAAATRAP